MKKLGFGLMRLPLADPKDHSNIDVEKVKEMVDAYMAKGFTHFDTAYVYHGGKSEVAFREAVVKRYPRESFTVTDKLPLFNRPDRAGMEKIFAEMLERCGVEYFDYVWLHAMNKDLYKHAQEVDAFGYLSELKAEGKIKNIGFSFHDNPETLDLMLTEHPEVDAIQLQINYVDWEGNWVQAKRCYEISCKHNVPVIVMEPIKGGSLAQLPKKAEKLFKDHDPDASSASWAIRYAASFDNVINVLSGMSNMDHVNDNISYMENFTPLTEEEYKVIDEVSKIVKFAIPCTACRYCTDGCPMNIDIPEIFKVYNDFKKGGKERWEGVKRYKEELTVNGGRASDCIGCGQCTEHCPQNLDIPKLLSEVTLDLD